VSARIIAERAWQGATFAGRLLTVEIDGEPPAPLDAINFGDNEVIADVGPCRFEVLTVRQA
jgi:hypothetical protein